MVCLFPYLLVSLLTVTDVADRDIYVADASSPATPRGIDETHPAAATAAVALAQLHHNRLASDWDTDMVCVATSSTFGIVRLV